MTSSFIYSLWTSLNYLLVGQCQCPWVGISGLGPDLTCGLAVQTDRADMKPVKQRQCFFNLNSKITSLLSTMPDPSHSQHLNTPSLTEILQTSETHSQQGLKKKKRDCIHTAHLIINGCYDSTWSQHGNYLRRLSYLFN